MVVAPLSHTVVSCGGRVHCGLDSGRFSACPQVTAVMAAGRGGGTAQEKDPVSIMRGGVCAGLDSCRPHVAGTGQGRAPGARGPPPRPRSWRIRRSPAHSSPSWMRGHREPGPQLITVEGRFRWSMALSSPCRRWRASSSGRRSRSSEAGRVRQIRRSAPSPVPSRDGDAVLGGPARFDHAGRCMCWSRRLLRPHRVSARGGRFSSIMDSRRRVRRLFRRSRPWRRTSEDMVRSDRTSRCWPCSRSFPLVSTGVRSCPRPRSGGRPGWLATLATRGPVACLCAGGRARP